MGLGDAEVIVKRERQVETASGDNGGGGEDAPTRGSRDADLGRDSIFLPCDTVMVCLRCWYVGKSAQNATIITAHNWRMGRVEGFAGLKNAKNRAPRNLITRRNIAIFIII